LPEAWKFIDDEARRALRVHLSGRKLVDFVGPLGWTFAAVNRGRLTLLAEQPVAGVHVGLRCVQPLVELRTPIVLDIMELDSIARGATHLDLAAVVEACGRMAGAEDGAIFNGYAQAGITGIIGASPHAPIAIPDAAELPQIVVLAQERLRIAGVGGPYALVLGTSLYESVTAATLDGYPISRRIERLLVGGQLVHAPSIAGAVLLSVRGGDYELTVGQDLSIGYASHDKKHVELYLTESFTFRVLEPAASVHLEG
jgi:uncharacterized linocin/CFP29 family protein